MRRALDFAVYLVVRLLIAVVQALPVDTGAAMARWLAWIFADVLKLRRKVLEENLSHAFPELSAEDRRRLARKMWEHLFLLVVEVAHTPRKIHDTNWRDYVQLGGEKELMLSLLSPRPTIIVTGHFGNFEVGGYVLGVLGFPTHTVARTLDNAYLDRFVNDFRGRTGQHIIPKNGGYDQIETVMDNCGTMTFLADQYAGPKGCWVTFFGRPASAHKAIALLSFEHNAPVHISAVSRAERPLHFVMRQCACADPLAGGRECRGVREMTQWYSDWLETIIRAEPDQYWWLHRRWKDTREKKPKTVKQAA
jgi:KDO2-lipid IV(A) lauroyltransferase